MPRQTPKLAFPFRPGHYREQGLIDEVMDCVEVLLSTEIGERAEVPDYGIPDQTFRQGGVDVERIIRIIEYWEPRAPTTIERGLLLDRIERLTVLIRGGPNG